MQHHITEGILLDNERWMQIEANLEKEWPTRGVHTM